MGNVRGRHLIDAVGFVSSAFGSPAPAKVLAALDKDARAVFARRLVEADWYPLGAFGSYLATAGHVLAPADPEFCRRQGRYAGGRQKGFLARMIAAPETAMRMAPTIWRMYYDVGYLKVVGDDPETAASQIHAFPTTPELCQRFRGTWEGVSSSPGRPTESIETLCTLRGDPCCEFRVRVLPPEPQLEASEQAPFGPEAGEQPVLHVSLERGPA